MYTALIVLSVIAVLLMGVGALLFWRPWTRRSQQVQQEEDEDVRREAELDELRHQFEVESIRGAIHRRRVFDHAVWPTHGLLTAVEDAVGHRITEQTVAPLVGYVTEQTLQETLGTTGQTNRQEERDDENEPESNRHTLWARLTRLWARTSGWLKVGLKWVAILLVIYLILSGLTSYFRYVGLAPQVHPTELANREQTTETLPTAIAQVDEQTWKIVYNPREELDTGIVIPTGKIAQVSATGTVRGGDGDYSPNGGGKVLPNRAYHVPEGKANALAVRTSFSQWRIVGSSGEIKGDDGTLRFVINDDLSWGDNLGNWTITVTLR